MPRRSGTGMHTACTRLRCGCTRLRARGLMGDGQGAAAQACTRREHRCGLQGSGVGAWVWAHGCGREGSGAGVAARTLGRTPQLEVDGGDAPQHGSVVGLVGEDCATNAPPRSLARRAITLPSQHGRDQGAGSHSGRPAAWLPRSLAPGAPRGTAAAPQPERPQRLPAGRAGGPCTAQLLLLNLQGVLGKDGSKKELEGLFKWSSHGQRRLEPLGNALERRGGLQVLRQ